MRYGFTLLWMLFWSVPSAIAQVSIGITIPGVSIGINMPLYPDLVQVSGYPVYYAPRVDSNYFFYDGMYWVYQRDHWYASSWYNGPWGRVAPGVVPLCGLRPRSGLSALRQRRNARSRSRSRYPDSITPSIMLLDRSGSRGKTRAQLALGHRGATRRNSVVNY